MPSVGVITQTIALGDVTPTEGDAWFHSAYPFRIPLDIQINRNMIQEGEVVTVHLPGRFVTSNKIRADLSDIVVAKYDGKYWQTAPSSREYVDVKETIIVRFQAVQNIEKEDVYYVYFGNSAMAVVPEVDGFNGEYFHNSTGLNSPYVSFTNPSQDWEVFPTYVVGERPGAKVYSEISVERFKIIGRKGPDAGMIDVRVNDVYLETIDLFSEVELQLQELGVYEVVAPRRVTQIRIDISKNRNHGSDGSVVRIDDIMYDTHATIDIGSEEINPALDWISNVGAS